jgi:hypothetical protein
MDLWHKLLLGLTVVLVIAGIVIAFYWLQAHDEAIRARAKIEADQTAFEKLSAQQKSLDDQLAQIKKDQADQLTSLTRSFNQAQSPAQLSALLSAIMKQPVTVVTPPATAANPNPAPVIQLPDTPQSKTYFQECESCKVNYAAAQKQLSAADTNAQLDKQKIALVTNERDTYKELAKGGPWFKRAGKALVVGLCAGAGGAVGASHGAGAAALGAVGGALVCSILR